MDTILSAFMLPGKVLSCAPYGSGLIEQTFLVVLDTGHRYILQRIDRDVFHDVTGLMENFSTVTRAIASKTADPRGCLRLIPTKSGKDWLLTDTGDAWRITAFIEDSVCLSHPESLDDLRSCGVGFGTFLYRSRDIPAAALHETIPGFHDTPYRFRMLHEAIDADRAGRASSVKDEIDYALSKEPDAGTLQDLRDRGALPLRVTHNDTKASNILLDRSTRRPLCVIDLDTVMPGLVAYDFGDAIRSCSVSAAADAPSGIVFDLARCRAFASGYLESCGTLTGEEYSSLPLGIVTMTLECGIRFLTDYLNGDRYFSIGYETHNLVRTRKQFDLLRDMEHKMTRLQTLLEECIR